MGQVGHLCRGRRGRPFALLGCEQFVCPAGRVPSGAWGPAQPRAALSARGAAADTTTFLLPAAFLFCWARDITREALQLKQSCLASIRC